MHDFLIVGCGLSGMIVARELANHGKKVHIIERRNHIGGNIYDYRDENGILIQKYGPHVFFTDHLEIEQYITQFVATYPFYPECRTYIGGKCIPMPFNFVSIEMIYEDEQYARQLKSDLISEFGEGSIVSVLDVINSNTKSIHAYGMYMYENEYRKYTAKQWNREIEDIVPSVFMRVPVYISYKKSYLRQKFQYMPLGGFTKLAERIVEHANISIELNRDALEDIRIDELTGQIFYHENEFDGKIIYTGPLDQLFGYRFGRLPYRALEFVYKDIPKKDTLSTPLSAFPESDKYIRITDYTQFPPQNFGDRALVAIEFPVEYRVNELCGNEPYYPTLTAESIAIYRKYRALADKIDVLYPCGRLADFKYYNMDMVIENALELVKKLLKSE